MVGREVSEKLNTGRFLDLHYSLISGRSAGRLAQGLHEMTICKKKRLNLEKSRRRKGEEMAWAFCSTQEKKTEWNRLYRRRCRPTVFMQFRNVDCSILMI